MTPSTRSLPLFFLLVFALSLPFWWLGSTIRWQLLPGVPVSAFMFICPCLAAMVLTYRDDGAKAAVALFKRSFDYRRIVAKVWLIPIFLLVPVAMLLSFAAMRLLGRPVPTPEISILSVSLLFTAFFVAAVGEELGWSGYAIEPLQERWHALPASLILGAVWAAWHFVPLLQAGNSSHWIAWWCLVTVALRVLHTWLYNNTGRSVFGAALFHASANLSWQLFPNNGSHYDPEITGLILATMAVFVVLIWGPRRLRRYRYA
ncbi:type II CAAX endopeptidase family protein [soil metagenome]